MSLAERVLEGDRLALARLLTQIESESPQGQEALAALFPHTGQAHLIGVTGAPGTGKSTLVNQLALHLRRKAAENAAPQIGIIAVDPSSPFTGGAILGDRVRMRDLAGDSGVFIRSMASRGALGGIARATAAVAQAMDAAGYEMILIETVGAGQAEVDIASAAHTTVVVEAPGLGDVIQANKAGILEIADILVVNKADLPGAENTQRGLAMALEMSPAASHDAQPSWTIPVLPTVATSGEGVPELAKAIAAHREHLSASGDWERRERTRLRSHLEGLLRERLMDRFLHSQTDGRFEQVLEKVLARRMSPAQAADELIGQETP